MHDLLLRQLRRQGAAIDQPPAQWEAFLLAVSDTYLAADEDRSRLERAMDLMSREVVERYERIRKDHDTLQHAEAALRASETRLRKEIKDRQEMELELRLKQKLEAVGQLAAGIAHEINTPVQFVGDSAHFLETAFEDFQKLFARYRAAWSGLGADSPFPQLAAELREAEIDADLEYLEAQVPRAFARVREGIARVSAIVGAVKDFAHPDQRQMAAADLNRAIESTLVVSRNEYKYVADVETTFGDLPAVECHLGDLNQVFLNLIVNAAHAIEGRDPATQPSRGRIAIATRVEADEAVITIADNGGGIPEAIRERVFDPFFTTKGVGRGTGQGLAISRSIVVEKHRGSLTFESREGEGTTFTIRVPIRAEATVEEAA